MDSPSWHECPRTVRPVAARRVTRRVSALDVKSAYENGRAWPGVGIFVLEKDAIPAKRKINRLGARRVLLQEQVEFFQLSFSYAVK